MSISFHCENCKKKVKASDEAGGKWGSCPFCKHRCYIPLPPAENEEELKLLPLDHDFETNYHKMMRETYSLQQNILHETDVSNGKTNGKQSHELELVPDNERELVKAIVNYLRLMADGELAQADSLTDRLTTNPDQAKDILRRMLKSEKPEPELQDIAPRVLQGLIKDLAARL